MIDLPPILARMDKIAPSAAAVVSGDAEHPKLCGRVLFYETNRGTLVRWDFSGLPDGSGCAEPVLGLHIHAGTACTGTPEEPFANADGHFNPAGCEHPDHAGDLPPLFSCSGSAFGMVLTDRFPVREVVGRTVIVHARQDDFTSQPSGNAGPMIACGVIEPVEIEL